MFEWQQHSRSQSDVPHFEELLAFINLRRAQAAETVTPDIRKKNPEPHPPPRKDFRRIGSFNSFVTPNEGISCVVRKSNHLLHTCPDFKALGHENKMSLLKTNSLCFIFLRGKMKQTQRLKLGHSNFNLFFKVMKSRKSFRRVRERVPEVGGRRDK